MLTISYISAFVVDALYFKIGAQATLLFISVIIVGTSRVLFRAEFIPGLALII